MNELNKTLFDLFLLLIDMEEQENNCLAALKKNVTEFGGGLALSEAELFLKIQNILVSDEERSRKTKTAEPKECTEPRTKRPDPLKLSNAKLKDATRLRREQFLGLAEMIRSASAAVFADENERSTALSCELRLAIFLHRGAHRLSYRELGARWGCCQQTAREATVKMAVVIVTVLGSLLIRPPNAAEIRATERTVRRKHNLPGVYGFIDGSLMPRISPPGPSHLDYLDRKNDYSLNIQVVAGSHHFITDVTLGHGGSANDAGIYASSELGQQNELGAVSANVQVEVGGRMINPVIVGDQGYPRTAHLLVARRGDDDEVTEIDQHLHRAIVNARSTLSEGTFGILKQRFRYLDLKCRDSVVTQVVLIHSYCIIHNFIVLTSSPEAFAEYLESSARDENNNEPLRQTRNQLYAAYDTFFSSD